ncbi:hypothetical protein CALCODRAFT_270988 [Calocera cornea HHB12733]|uniref:FHA domain-containing protein n=1 Tax=Calocera cornea HHB12733 TaxID=1353952 RepID=A0A165G9K7_9BASI|nr:hypothetical protein CALCODRAFT_270988 [Calocera cornea HHB12733]
MLSPRASSPDQSSDLPSKHALARAVLQEIQANTIPSASDDITSAHPQPKILHRNPTRAAGEAMDHGRELLITPPPSSPYIDLRIPLQHVGSVHIMATSKPKTLSPAMATPPPSSSPCNHSHHARTPSVSTSVALLPDDLVIEAGHPVVIGRMAKPLDASKTGPHLTQPGTVLFYTLPLKELEVSRLHIIVERVPHGVRLKAIGKNGLRVGNHFVGEGQEIVLPEQKGLVNLDLWVKTIKLQCASPHGASPAPSPIQLKSEEPEMKEFRKEFNVPPTASTAVFSDITIPITPTEDRRETTSLPPSSPASSPLSSLPSDDEMSPPRGVKRKAGSLPPSSPAKRIIQDEDEDEDDDDEDEDMDADGEEQEDEEDEEDAKLEDDDEEDLLGESRLAHEASPTPSAYSDGRRPTSLNQNGKRASASPQSPTLKRPRTAQAEAELRTAVLPHLVTALALSVTTTTPLSHLLPEVLEQSALASYDREDIIRICRDLLEDGVKGTFGKVVRRGKVRSSQYRIRSSTNHVIRMHLADRWRTSISTMPIRTQTASAVGTSAVSVAGACAVPK